MGREFYGFDSQDKHDVCRDIMCGGGRMGS